VHRPHQRLPELTYDFRRAHETSFGCLDNIRRSGLDARVFIYVAISRNRSILFRNCRGAVSKLFANRYHARYLKTPREVRNALRYVLLNRKHHAAEKKYARQWIDPCSSAAWFDGWAQPVRGDEPWKRELLAMERPTTKATVWLLTTGWKRHGLLRFDEAPA
jgi:hypothetical protein